MTDRVATIILAAGDGKRMQSAIPKVMSLLHGRPLIDYVVSAAEASGVSEKPIVVVSPKHTLVQDFLQDRAAYIVQSEQLGTGHAVSAAEPAMRSGAEQIIVLYGDMPFLQPASITRLADEHKTNKAAVSLITATASDFAEWRSAFTTFGRIVRDPAGNFKKIVECKDANEAELQIRELSTGYYCFRADWLWPHLKKLKNQNAQKEYYLTDLIKMAIDEGEKISSISIDPREAIGINTKEDLDMANQSL